MVLDTGYRVEGITHSSGILMAGFCPPNSFLHLHPACRFLSIQRSPSPPFVARFWMSSFSHLLPPFAFSELVWVSLNTLQCSLRLSSANVRSLFHLLARPAVFFNGGFCPFHVSQKQRILVSTEARTDKCCRAGREKEIPTLSVDLH